MCFIMGVWKVEHCLGGVCVCICTDEVRPVAACRAGRWEIAGWGSGKLKELTGDASGCC